MKNIIRKSVIAASFVIAIAASSFKANATENKLVYDKSQNAKIGITVENATGASFTIKDKRGNVVYQGKVKSDKTFYIPTDKLAKGEYQFQMGILVLQEFVIK